MNAETPRQAAGSRGPDSGPAQGGGSEAESADGREPVPVPAFRRSSVEETAGALTGVYEPGYLETLREDWDA